MHCRLTGYVKLCRQAGRLTRADDGVTLGLLSLSYVRAGANAGLQRLASLVLWLRFRLGVASRSGFARNTEN